MMSRRDAIRSYRRQLRRACLMRNLTATCGEVAKKCAELFRRGDRLQFVYAQHMPASTLPIEVSDALTSAELSVACRECGGTGNG